MTYCVSCLFVFLLLLLLFFYPLTNDKGKRGGKDLSSQSKIVMKVFLNWMLVIRFIGNFTWLLSPC